MAYFCRNVMYFINQANLQKKKKNVFFFIPLYKVLQLALDKYLFKLMTFLSYCLIVEN